MVHLRIPRGFLKTLHIISVLPRHILRGSRYATSTSATLLQGNSKYVFLIANNESLHYFYIKPSCSADALITRQAKKFVCLAFKHFSVYANFHSGKRSKLFFVYVHSVVQTIVSAIVYANIDGVLHEVLLSVVSNYGKQCMFSTSGKDTKYNMANS